MARPTRVLILGGGFAAVSAYRAMRRAARKGLLDITVVCRENFMSMHGQVGEMVTGHITPGSMVNPVRRIFPTARIHVAEIESIDLAARTIVTSRSLDGFPSTLEYDQALILLGSADNVRAYPGLLEHAFRLKRYEDCLRLRNHLIMMFELADVESDPEERRRLLTFFVAGGGYSGTAMAGELADFARRLTKRDFPGIRREECRVVLVHPGSTLLPEFYGSGNLERPVKSFPKLVAFSERHIRGLGVEVMLNTRVAAVTPNDVYLSNDRHIPTRTVISAVGIVPEPVVRGLPLERDQRGRLVVDQYLNVKGHPELWSGGDCAAVPHRQGGTCPPVALYAVEHGRVLGKNVVRSVTGKPLRPFRVDVKMQGVSIGRRMVVGEIAGVGIRGKLTWILFRSVILKLVPSWDRRIRLLADWIIWPFVGRDITQVGSASTDDFEVDHNSFEAGDVMAERRRPVRHIHVIVEGEAEAIREREGRAENIRTLRPGHHFGRLWLEQEDVDRVCARSRVRTVSASLDQAQELLKIVQLTMAAAPDSPPPKMPASPAVAPEQP